MKRKIVVPSIVVSLVFLYHSIPWIVNQFALNEGIQQFDKNYPEIDYQLKVSTRLSEIGIRNKIDHEGVLRFNYRHKEIVNEIYNQLFREHKPDWPNIYWADEGIRKNLMSYLDQNNIPYLIRKLDANGGDYILWPPDFDIQVQSYNKKVLEKLKVNTKNDI